MNWIRRKSKESKQSKAVKSFENLIHTIYQTEGRINNNITIHFCILNSINSFDYLHSSLFCFAILFSLFYSHLNETIPLSHFSWGRRHYSLQFLPSCKYWIWCRLHSNVFTFSYFIILRFIIFHKIFPSSSILRCYNNGFRDWLNLTGWKEAENV